MVAGRRPGVGAPTSGAPSPIDGNGGAAALHGDGWVARRMRRGRRLRRRRLHGRRTHRGSRRRRARLDRYVGTLTEHLTDSELNAELNSEPSTHRHADRFISLSRNGLSRLDFDFFASERPINAWPSWRKVSAARCDDDSSAIIWPLLAAVPKICG